MRIRLPALALAATLLGALLVPVAGVADHIALTGNAELVLTGTDKETAKLRATAKLRCTGGVAGGLVYSGELFLVDAQTGTERTLGAVNARTARFKAAEPRTNEPRDLFTVLRVSCSEAGGHGSGVLEFSSEPVTIPAREPGDQGGGGGEPDPGGEEDPLVLGGCEIDLEGSSRDDRLRGTADGDLIFGLEGSDRIKGGGGHDCLVGGQDDDILAGQGGSDRLTGSGGNDRLTGGGASNAYDAGPGRDVVRAQNDRRDVVRCGPGKDRAMVDADDRVRGCEKIQVD